MDTTNNGNDGFEINMQGPDRIEWGKLVVRRYKATLTIERIGRPLKLRKRFASPEQAKEARLALLANKAETHALLDRYEARRPK